MLVTTVHGCGWLLSQQVAFMLLKVAVRLGKVSLELWTGECACAPLNCSPQQLHSHSQVQRRHRPLPTVSAHMGLEVFALSSAIATARTVTDVCGNGKKNLI